MNCKGKKLQEIVRGKKVLFITTKNIDYIRNTQEIRYLKEYAESVEVIYSDSESYVVRVFSVWRQMTKSVVRQNDIIFFGFSPQLILPFMNGRLKGKLIIIDFFISVYDTLICDRKKFKPDGLMARLYYKLDKNTLKKANYVITDTKTHADFFISEFGCDKDIFETIYLEADSTIYYPRVIGKRKSLEDKFIVLYFGSILPLQGVDVVLEAISSFKQEKYIYFDIIGPISSKYNKPVQENVSYTEWLSQEELAERIAQADLCLAGHFSGEINKAKRTIPGKAYIYEMMKKPMILGDSMANHELFSEDSFHYFVEMGKSEEIVKLIRRELITWLHQSLKN